MKINKLKKIIFLILFTFSICQVSSQVTDFNIDTWGFEQTSGIEYVNNSSSFPDAPGPGNIVEAMTQLVSGSTTNIFIQSSDAAHNSSQSMLADFNVLTDSPKLQSFRPSGANDLIGNFTTGSTGVYKASIWIYMDALQSGTVRFKVNIGSITAVNFDFDLSTVTKVNTWTKISVEESLQAGTNLFAEVTFINSVTLIASTTKVYLDDFKLEKVTTETWTGTTDSDWFTTTNWDTGTIPTEASTVVIPSAPANQPEITTDRGAVANNLTADSGASLIVENGSSLRVGNTASGDITYNVNVADTNWHLISSPVDGEQYDNTWIANNNILASTTPGKTDNRAIATYNNTVASNNWDYFSANPGTPVTFGSGIGYSLKRITVGNYTFTGTFPTSNVTPTISQNSSNWNLVGNPFPSFLNISNLITANTTNLSPANQAIYVWNGTSYQSLTTGYLQPGQAFFINSNVASGALEISEGLQSHETGVTFYRTNNTEQRIVLNISDGETLKSTEINYIKNKTIGLDPRFDIGLFDGVTSDLKLYSILVSNDNENAFEKQALPNASFEDLIIPIGVKAKEGKEITFSATISNLPEGIELFLEDRIENIFIKLDENNTFKTTLSSDSDVVDRFFLHTSQRSLSINEPIFSTSISIYQSDSSTLKMTGLPEGDSTVLVYDIFGRQIVKNSFTSSNTKEIKLPNFTTGIYLVKLNTVEGTTTKKIVLR
ncbi:T9SS type A sorting domain-containing protein [uncultured Polaribacter sp.]|uniref:T9SS type A sorting domain-containing protein n=1 Tax=uncultured Polaribacter sp. TaxID=174711 RepID=UPI0026188FC1|nr:T9SS type A sorting domain-containing protein [uncultured Polaribacter sp.]